MTFCKLDTFSKQCSSGLVSDMRPKRKTSQKSKVCLFFQGWQDELKERVARRAVRSVSAHDDFEGGVQWRRYFVHRWPFTRGEISLCPL